VWIDSGNQASTYALSAVDEALLDRVEIGRAFTPLQHFQLVSRLDEFVSKETEVVVLPSIDLLYAKGQMKEEEAERCFQEMLERLEEYRKKFEFKVLLSTESQIGFHALEYVTNRIEMSENSEGTRYSSKNYETLVYPVGKMYQTTVPYYQRGEQWEEPTPLTATTSTI
jgi:polyhydroxyalkanoate synthesis regulator phasin